jgi:hypothetical protein
MERWASVREAIGYEVSSNGRVRSHKRGFRLLSTATSKSNGYPTVNIGGIPRSVHRLMWVAFNHSIPTTVLVRHRNDIKTDNRLSNLTIGSHLDNRFDSHLNGRGKLRIDIAMVPAILAELKMSSTRKLAVKYGVSHTTIRKLKDRPSYFLDSSSSK